MKVSLVLGSGGARGYSHIGVIEEIKRRGHEIVAISGTSMGAVIGGIEAAGKLDDFSEWATGLTQFDVLRLYDLALTEPGMIKADRIFSVIGSIIGPVNIEDLAIPFTAVATDIVNHREVWFQRGSLELAMRASCALPTFITPVMVNGKILADGGLMNPVPVEPTAAIPSDLTIAVSLNGRPNTIPAASAVSAGSEDGTANEDRQSLAERLRRGVSGLVDVGLFRRDGERQSSPADITPDPQGTEEGVADTAGRAVASELVGGRTELDATAGSGAAGGSSAEDRGKTPPLYEMGQLPPDLNTMGVVNMSLETMQSLIERYRAAAHTVNIKISIPAAASGILDFHKAAEVIEVGRQMAITALDDAGI